MTAKELDSRVAVVHGCFSEKRGDSYYSKHLLLGDIASEAARQLTSFSDQPGCAHAHICS